MSSDHIYVKEVAFLEHPHLKSSQASGNDFDIAIDGEFSLNAYCTSLIEKIFTLHQSAFPQFINYQSSLVENAFTWLNRLEKLLSENEELFLENKKQSRFTKLYLLIDGKRKETQADEIDETNLINLSSKVNGCNDTRVYDFSKTKKHSDKMDTLKRKIFFLNEQITIYEQYPPHFVNQHTPKYGQQCQLEIDRLIRQEKFDIELADLNPPTPLAIKKLPINTETKSWVHIFFQLMHIVGNDGKPVLPYTVAELAEHICTHYCQMDGTPFNLNTVRTYLNQSRIESRPKNDKEIRLDLDNI